MQQEGKRQEESDADVEARQRMVSLITTLCDWLKKPSRHLLEQSDTRPNHTRLRHTRFSPSEPVTCIWFECSLVHQIVFVGSDWLLQLFSKALN